MSSLLAMPMPSVNQADFYAEHGYLVVDNLLSADEIAELEADLVRLARGAYPTKSLKPVPSDLSDKEALRRILCIHMPHFVSPVIHRYTTHSGLADVLGQIVGAHLPGGHWNGGVKCMQSMFFAKPPGKPGQAWHQDECFIPTRDRSLCGAWIAIDDFVIPKVSAVAEGTQEIVLIQRRALDVRHRGTAVGKYIDAIARRLAAQCKSRLIEKHAWLPTRSRRRRRRGLSDGAAGTATTAAAAGKRQDDRENNQ